MAEIDVDLDALKSAVRSSLAATMVQMGQVRRAFDPLHYLKGSGMCGPSPAGQVFNTHFDGTSAAILTILTELEDSVHALHEAMSTASANIGALEEASTVGYLQAVKNHANAANNTFAAPVTVAAPGAVPDTTAAGAPGEGGAP
ncbi:MAG: hypothetical protein IPM08_01690 [Actinomycetales bacterium]|nr:hypothetical protein [Actinomycetales bacterium]